MEKKNCNKLSDLNNAMYVYCECNYLQVLPCILGAVDQHVPSALSLHSQLIQEWILSGATYTYQPASSHFN